MDAGDLEYRKLEARLRLYAHVSKSVCISVVWVGIALVSIILGGTCEPPMIAGSICTCLIWLAKE